MVRRFSDSVRGLELVDARPDSSAELTSKSLPVRRTPSICFLIDSGWLCALRDDLREPSSSTLSWPKGRCRLSEFMAMSFLVADSIFEDGNDMPKSIEDCEPLMSREGGGDWAALW